MVATTRRVEIRAEEKRVGRCGNEHLTRASRGRHPRREMNRDPAHILSSELDLACMQPGALLEAERRRGFGHLDRTTDAARGRIEDRQQPVAGRLDLATMIPL